MHDFDAKDVERLFQLPAFVIRSLIRAGHLRPVKTRGRARYSFEDLIVLRTASALRAAKVPAHKISRALQMIRESRAQEPDGHVLSVTAVGNNVAVREGQRLRDSETGQYALPLESAGDPASVHVLGTLAGSQAGPDADAYFLQGCDAEEDDAGVARAAYQACLALDGRHVGARVNLGRLLHLGGELAEAERTYRGAPTPDALLCFNLGLVLEDLGRETEAIAAYRESVALDPGCADAHFNLARIHERNGDARAALRHLLAYRRLAATPSGE